MWIGSAFHKGIECKINNFYLVHQNLWSSSLKSMSRGPQAFSSYSNGNVVLIPTEWNIKYWFRTEHLLVITVILFIFLYDFINLICLASLLTRVFLTFDISIHCRHHIYFVLCHQGISRNFFQIYLGFMKEIQRWTFLVHHVYGCYDPNLFIT